MQYNSFINWGKKNLWVEMVSSTENDVPIRDASTVILIRKKDNNNYVLMGQT